MWWKPSAKLEVLSNFFTVRVADSWNSVPDEIEMARSVGQFEVPSDLFLKF